VFCHAVRSDDDEACLVLQRTAHTILMLNLYPYVNGHVLIAPRDHVARPTQVGPEVRAEMMEMMVRVEEALEAEYRPGGLNVGMNLGACAGAGIADHFHMHVLPRWEGDTSFMTTVGEMRVLSQDLRETWMALRGRLDSGRAR
jgi:ATP adenylyltransferase